MVKITEMLNEQLSRKIRGFVDLENTSEKKLKKVRNIRISKNEIQYLKFFPCLEELVVDSFPSICKDDIAVIAESNPKLKVLKIQEQNAIFDLDLSLLENLQELFLIHNDNLIDFKVPNNLKLLVFFDNKDYRNIAQLVDIILKYRTCSYAIDIVYCFKLWRTLFNNKLKEKDLIDLVWVESVGLREYRTYEYNYDEIKYLIDYVTYIVSKYIFVTDGFYEKFGILYKWMIHNIEFINEEDNKKKLNNENDNILEVFKNKRGGRLSYAKAFQFLLSFVDIDSAVVYSLGALDNIGYYNGEKIYSLLGISDYALLRVQLDDKYYYSDIAWDSMVNDFKYFDVLRLFLVSKDELKMRHKLVGEGNIDKTYSYHGDDTDDLITFAEMRIKEVDEILKDVDRENINIDSTFVNSKLLLNELNVLKGKIKTEDKNSLKVRELNKTMKSIESELDDVMAMYIRYLNLRENIIKNYAGYFLEHYLGTNNLNNIDALNELVRVKKDNYVLSEYMYNILNECLK